MKTQHHRSPRSHREGAFRPRRVSVVAATIGALIVGTWGWVDTPGAGTAAANAAGEISALAAGVPEAPRQAAIETFEQGLGTTASGLAAYASGRYTASSGWVSGSNCTGVLVNYLATYPNASFCPTTSTRVSAAARETRRMADVLGQVAAGVAGSSSATAPANGSTSATQTNHALTAFPAAAVAGSTTVAQSVSGTGISAPAARYYSLRMNAVGAQCGTNNASLSLNLVSGGATVLTGFSSPVVPCASTGAVYYTSPALAANQGSGDAALPASVRAAAYSGTTAALLTPAQISAAQVQLVNTVTGAGGAFGVDNVRVMEVSPALDMAF